MLKDEACLCLCTTSGGLNVAGGASEDGCGRDETLAPAPLFQRLVIMWNNYTALRN